MLGRERVTDFITWCKKNNVRGFLGEFAVPRSDPRWNEVLENFMQALDEAGFGGTYWAAGTYWGDGYPMSIHPADKNYSVDRPQMEVMLKHLSPAHKSAPVPAAFFIAHMGAADFFGLIVAVLVIAYLFYALIRGENL